MEMRQVEGIDTYNFPSDLLGNPLLAWMGEDYVRYIALTLLRRFRQQDPGTKMLTIKCQHLPYVQTRAGARNGLVHEVIAEFDLQIVLRASDGKCWQLTGDGRFGATELDKPGPTKVAVGFDLHSSEAIA